MNIDTEFLDFFESPIGTVQIKADQTHIVSILFVDQVTGAIQKNKITDICRTQLQEYFNTKRNNFDIPLAFKSTDFQHRVWHEVQKIELGKTKSYLDIALQLNDKNAVRAVGLANGKNPFLVVVPCHRVIGSNSNLVGYAAGLWRKEWLLEHERKMVGNEQLSIF